MARSPAPEPRELPVDLEADPRARRLARKARRQENRRHAVLACARAVLVAHGPVAFTMEQLAAAADTSKATLYYYFRSREEVVGALALEVLRREVEVLGRVVIAADTGIDGLAALVRARVEHHLADPDGFRILYVWAPVLGDPQRLLLAEVYPLSAVVNTTLEAKLQRDRKSGLLHPDAHPRRLADLAWATAHGLLSLAIAQGNGAGFPWRELCEEACSALVRAAKSADPPRSIPP
jgi:TetR/AcrR family transcriptional regulator